MSDKFHVIEVSTGYNHGTHSTREHAEKRIRRLVSMSNGRRTADWWKIETEPVRVRQSNPRRLNSNHPDVKKAVKLYRNFREAAPKRGRSIEFEMPTVLMVMGNVRFIGYDTTRAGKTELYKHDFAPGSRPILCADGKTGQLFIVEGRYHVTAGGELTGIVDIDGKGKEIDDGH